MKKKKTVRKPDYKHFTGYFLAGIIIISFGLVTYTLSDVVSVIFGKNVKCLEGKETTYFLFDKSRDKQIPSVLTIVRMFPEGEW